MKELITAVLVWTDGMETVIIATQKIGNAALVILEQFQDIVKALENKNA